LAVLVPHFSDAAAYVDPTHRKMFSAQTFDYFDPETKLGARYGFYSRARFKNRLRLLMLQPPLSRVPYLQRWCNRHIETYERLFCYVIRAAGLYVELEPQKL
jgi:hypothetical protein